MKEFLNIAMMKNIKGNTSKVNRFIKLFPKTTSFIKQKFGEKPFHLRGRLIHRR